MNKFRIKALYQLNKYHASSRISKCTLAQSFRSKSITYTLCHNEHNSEEKQHLPSTNY